MQTITARTKKQGMQGFSLIEILVTVVVLSIGLLGLAGLQLTGLKYNHSAYLRSQATLLASDIIDRMRANRDIARTGSYDISLGTSPPTASCMGTGKNCTPANMAAADLSEWIQNLQGLLPAGDGAISRTVTGNEVRFTIVIQWDDSHGEEAAVQLPVETVI